MKNEVLGAILDELRLAGVKPTVSAGGKHHQVWWQGPDGRPRIVGSSVTPSHQCAPHQARAEVRRILRADGMLNEPEQKATRMPSRLERLEHRIAKVEQMLAHLQHKSAISREG